MTSNLTKRIKEHNKGKNKSTKSRRPFCLVYCERFDDKIAAYKREWYFKNNGEGNKEMRKLVEQSVINAGIAKVVTARV